MMVLGCDNDIIVTYLDLSYWSIPISLTICCISHLFWRQANFQIQPKTQTQAQAPHIRSGCHIAKVSLARHHYSTSPGRRSTRGDPVGL